MDLGCALELGYMITDLGCRFLHPHRALPLRQLSFLYHLPRYLYVAQVADKRSRSHVFNTAAIRREK